MCQILGITGYMTTGNIHEYFTSPGLHTNAIRQYMYVKGSQTQPISGLLTIGEFTMRIDNYEEFIFGEEFDSIINMLGRDKKFHFDLILFARMEPETERETSEQYLYQPYYNQFTKSWYFVHGLISNATSIAKQEGLEKVVKIDTDLFAYSPNIDRLVGENGLEGNYIIFQKIQNRYGFEIINNSGLGVWKLEPSWFFFGSSNPFDADIVMFGTSRRSFYDSYILQSKIEVTTHKNYQIVSRETSKRVGFALYSGGLDITATVMQYKKEHKGAKVVGIYFDYGAQATEREIEAGLQAKQHGLLDHFDIVPNIKEFYEHLNLNSKLTDRNSKGEGEEEAESTLAYMPYRNTLFFTILAALVENYIETHKFENENISIDEDTQIDFLIGANLSEGMVYNDNTAAFLENIQNVINLGGKKNRFIEIYSPFVNKTKTEMLSHFTKEEIETIFELSYSCYYPKEDGSACGECGSCLLRQKALERISERD